MTDARLLTAAQVLAEFFPGTTLTERWVRQHLPRVQLAPRVVRFRASTVAAWIAERERPAA